jgi:hypothetical protein
MRQIKKDMRSQNMELRTRRKTKAQGPHALRFELAHTHSTLKIL